MYKSNQLRKLVLSALTLCVVSSVSVSQAYAARQESLEHPSINTTQAVNEYMLNPVVVTANRKAAHILETPAATTLLTADRIHKSGMKTTTDALSLVTGINNFAYGAGGADYGSMDARINLRGFDKGTLVLLNGMPINLDSKNSMDGFVNETVSSIEVVKGAASVLYGAEAIGGVINVITDLPKIPTTKVTIARGNLGYNKVEGVYSDDKMALTVAKEWFGARHVVSPLRTNKKGRLYYNNATKGNKLGVGLTAKLGDNLTFNWNHTERNSGFGQVEIGKKTAEANAKATKYYYYKDYKNYASLQYKGHHDETVTLFYDSRKLMGETANGFDFKRSENSSNYFANKIGLDAQKVWALNNGDIFIGGVLVDREHYHGLSKFNAMNVGNRSEYAVYGQYTHPFTDRFTGILGLRGQHITDDVKSYNVLLPQLQGLYRINDKSSYYVNIGRAFQLAKITENFKIINKGPYALAAGKHLRPEEGWNYEVGYKYADDTQQFTAALYYMAYSNIFKWETAEATATTPKFDYIVNAGTFRNYGIELDYEKIINDRWTVQAGISVSNPKNRIDIDKKWEQTYPKVQMTLGSQYVNGPWKIGASLNWLTARLKNIDGRTNPDLINLNAVVDYTVNPNNIVTLHLNNILNRHNVITNGSYEYWDLPFNWTLAYTHKF